MTTTTRLTRAERSAQTRGELLGAAQRRFFEGTAPYSSRVRGFAWQAARLTAANFLFAPQTSIWIAAERP